jgi:hypothetical protein
MAALERVSALLFEQTMHGSSGTQR